MAQTSFPVFTNAHENDSALIKAPKARGDVATKIKTQKPSLYKVYLLNDDYTPMDFVVAVLEAVFNKGREDATRIMLQVHHQGSGLAGVYAFDIAETKIAQVLQAAHAAGHPLQCAMERE